MDDRDNGQNPPLATPPPGGALVSVADALSAAPQARRSAVYGAANNNLTVGRYIALANSLPPIESDVGLQPSDVAPVVIERRKHQKRNMIIAWIAVVIMIAVGAGFLRFAASRV